MKIFMLVDCTKYELPHDLDLNLHRLSDRWGIPYQTARNSVSTGREIKYIRSKIIAFDVPKKELVSRIS